MVPDKSLDEVVNLIAALLTDVQTSHDGVFNKRSLRLTLNKVRARVRYEGIGFLTKSLPRLGKALDKALSGNIKLDSVKLGFDAMPNSKLPRFLGEFFSLVFHPDGTVLHNPCAESVRVMRQVFGILYKYKLPFTDRQEQDVIAKFVKTEQEVIEHSPILQSYALQLAEIRTRRARGRFSGNSPPLVLRRAQILLKRLFEHFDPTDIIPRHGPGAVSTGERLWEKYRWTNVSDRITDVYPFDAYFCASLSAVCDNYRSIRSITSKESSAKVILVPKDSRGPRLISAEPVDFQWVQQGLGKAIVRHVEQHVLTKHNVFFTDQGPNRRGAQLGSLHGRYATLDLNEASDRVSLELVRLLFPNKVLPYLEACRSLSTRLPDGRVLNLHKYAPMGSALCFPILALTVWAILTASTRNADARESILVYGDDVIVDTAEAANAIEQLESFGLKINRDKSCTDGLFRESCGMDAFRYVDVTPVRIRTVWSSSPSPESYSSWISYANSFYDRKCFNTYDYIVGRLIRLYGPIPSDDMHLACPSLREVPDQHRPKRKRTNRRLQKQQFYVYDLKSPVIHKDLEGWSMLLRYFTEGSKAKPLNDLRDWSAEEEILPFSVGQYTRRRTSMLVRRWR